MIDDFVTPKNYASDTGNDRTEPSSSPHQAAPHNTPSLMQRLKNSIHMQGWRSALTTIIVLVAAPLFALVLTIYVFQTYQVEGPSMEPTLQPADRLIVWKMPRTWAKITGNAYLPPRGDVVVFTEPELEQFGQESTKQLIKRIIALPGERVKVHGGTVTVYNDQRPNGFRPDAELAYGSSIGTTPGELDVMIPKDHVYVLGDNRVNSLDSRSFGPVHADNIIGDLAARVLPLDQARDF